MRSLGHHRMILISMVLANDHAFFSTTLNCWRRRKGGGGGGGGLQGSISFLFPFLWRVKRRYIQLTVKLGWRPVNDDCMVPVIVNLLMVNHLKYLPLLLEKWGGVSRWGGGGGGGRRVQKSSFLFSFKTSKSKSTELKLDCLMLIWLQVRDTSKDKPQLSSETISPGDGVGSTN